MSFYVNLAVTAERLLTKFGATLTFTRPTTVAFDPVLGAATGDATTFTGIGCKFGYRASEIDGVQVQRGDVRLICNAMATAPLIDDSVSLDSVSYRVMDVEVVKPAATGIIYKLQVRL